MTSNGSQLPDAMLEATPQPNVLSGGGSPLPWEFWGLVILTGIGAGIGGGLLMWLLRAVQHAAWSYHAGDFLDGVQRVTSLHRVLVLVGAAFVVALVRWVLRQASGGHGAELTAAIWFHSGRIAPLRALTNAVLSIVIVGMGASLGREAAPKQFGAVVANLLAGWRHLPSAQRRLLVACGAGAGMAAVYNVPFGGALFALEVLLGTLSLPLVLPALATSLIAVAVSWLLLPNEPTYTLPVFHVSAGELAWAMFAGPIAGLVSVGYVRLICWADAHKPKGVRLHGMRLLLVPLAVFVVLGCLAIPFPQLLGNGKDVVQLGFDSNLGLGLLVVLVILKPLATAACLGSGAPGGLFTPTMTFGALVGGLLGTAWAYLWPGTAPPGFFALIGAGAVLAASAQGPISSMALMIELTRRMDVTMVPMLLAVVGATLVARRLEVRSLYSGRVMTGKAASQPVAQQAAVEGTSEVVSAATPYAEIMLLLLRMGGRRKPVRVVDESGEQIGMIAPDQVIAPDAAKVPLAIATAADFVRAELPVATDHGTRTYVSPEMLPRRP